MKLQLLLGMLVASIVTLLIVSCGKRAEQTDASSNEEIKVDRLFTHDGCTVYRFADYGAARYFARCGDQVQFSHQEPCGKGCTREVTTVGAAR